MDHSVELFHQAFATFLFCIAVSLLFVGYQNYITVLNVSNKILTENIMYEQYNETEKILFRRGEIISLFFNQLEYEIEIDGLFIRKSEEVKELLSSYYIPEGDYRKSYVYDFEGNITRIKFDIVR